MKKIFGLLCALLLPLGLATPLQGAPANSFVSTLLRITGVSVTPSRQMGEERNKTGEIWIVNVDRRTPPRITSGDGYWAPVFMPGDQNILALKDETIVRIPVHGGAATILYPIKRVQKLVGFNKENPDQLLLLVAQEKKDDPPVVGLLSLKDGQIVSIPYDKTKEEDLDMLSHLKGWDRVYGTTRVYVKGETIHTPTSRIGYTDVYLQSADQPPVNLSKCSGALCGQPSLSHDGRLVVFIKSAQ